MDLATADDLAEYLHETTPLDPVKQSAAQLAVAAASQAVRDHTLQLIAPPEQRTHQVIGPGRRVFLPHPPVIPVTVASVTVDGEALAEWTHDEASHSVMRSDGAPWGERALVDVTYTHGFDETPGNVLLICLQAAARAYGNPYGYASESIGQWSGAVPAASVGAQLTAAEQTALIRYQWRGAA